MVSRKILKSQNQLKYLLNNIIVFRNLLVLSLIRGSAGPAREPRTRVFEITNPVGRAPFA